MESQSYKTQLKSLNNVFDSLSERHKHEGKPTNTTAPANHKASTHSPTPPRLSFSKRNIGKPNEQRAENVLTLDRGKPTARYKSFRCLKKPKLTYNIILQSYCKIDPECSNKVRKTTLISFTDCVFICI